MSKLLSLLILAALTLPAQTITSRIRGVVTDPSGALAPNAEVSVLHEATGLRRTMPSNASGQFAFDAMPLGKYNLSVTLQGFKKFNSLTITIGRRRINEHEKRITPTKS